MVKILKNILLLGFFMWALSSCTAEYHLQQAKKKNPSLFEVTIDTVVTETPAIVRQINCDSVGTEPIIMYAEIEGTKDSVRVEFKTVYKQRTVYQDRVLSKKDSTQIYEKLLEVTVDCPDQETIIKEVEVPVPVEPNLWQRLKYAAYLLVLILVLIAAWQVLKRK